MTTRVPSLKPYAVSIGVPSPGGPVTSSQGHCSREGSSTGAMAGELIGGNLGSMDGGILVFRLMFPQFWNDVKWRDARRTLNRSLTFGGMEWSIIKPRSVWNMGRLHAGCKSWNFFGSVSPGNPQGTVWCKTQRSNSPLHISRYIYIDRSSGDQLCFLTDLCIACPSAGRTYVEAADIGACQRGWLTGPES